MAFRGWPTEALDFYEGLEADNSKTYWTAHKSVYEEKVLAPMTDLLADLEPEFGAGKIFRPYRDVRFSADKSPYKTNIGATLEHGGYVQLSAGGLAAGAGMYQMGPDELDRYRRAVADERSGARLGQLVRALEAQKIQVTGHDALKTVPRGYPKDHPRADLLRNKGLVMWKEWPAGAWLGRSSAKTRVVEFLRASRPLMGWLSEHIGPRHS
jgi:uncharacterized protein (TIGR02453 family)